MDLLIATRNPAKIASFRDLLRGKPVELRTLAAFEGVPDFPEEGSDFRTNAIGKARWFAAHTGLPALSEDGGLEISALNGWPGVHSRRIFGDGRDATDEEMIAEVIHRMEGIPEGARTCRMRNVIAFAAPDGTGGTAEAVEEGSVALTPSALRTPGFPFHAIFVHPGYAGTTVDVRARDPSAPVMRHWHRAMEELLPTILAAVQGTQRIPTLPAVISTSPRGEISHAPSHRDV